MKNRVWMLLLSALFLVCVGLSIYTLMPGKPAKQAQIWSEGVLYQTVSLGVDQTLTVKTQHGSNTVRVENGKIAVIQADCPDGYCMDRGYCSGGAQIVCLPNKLVIQFVGEQEVDGAVG